MRWPIADLLDKEPYLFEFFQAVSDLDELLSDFREHSRELRDRHRRPNTRDNILAACDRTRFRSTAC